MTAVRNRSLVALVFAGVLALAGCSGSSNTSSSASAVAPEGAAGPAAASARAGAVPAPAKAPDQGSAQAPGAADAASAYGATGAVNPQAVAGQKLARVASLSVAVGDIRTAAAQARAATHVAGGLVLQEDLNAAPGIGSGSGVDRTSKPGIPDPPRGSASLTLQVPADKLDATLDRLSALGTVTARGAGSEDVTAVHVDTQSRIRTLQASLDRVRALMAKAATLDQVVALEREVTTRQSDLEALQAQLAALDRRVDTATITVVLTPQQERATDGSGTGSGIGDAFTKGWQAFVAAAIWVVSALAAILPFALVAAALWWLGRRIWHGRHTGPTRRTGLTRRTGRSGPELSDDPTGPAEADRTPAESGPRSR